jgi:mannosyltransferase OCH1-like enzyme
MTIPKIVHHVWLGDAVMHPLMVKWQLDWKRLNPDWKHLLWREVIVGNNKVVLRHDGDTSNFIDLGDEYHDLLDRSLHLSQQSNVWRYAIIHHFGGVYSDTDVEPILPLGETFDHVPAAVSAGRGTGVFECGLFASEPGSPFTMDLFESLLLRDPMVHGSMGPKHLTEVARRHPEVVVLPEKEFLFDPNPWQMGLVRAGIMDLRKCGSVSPETKIIHHSSSVWFPDSFKVREQRGGNR